MSPKQKGFMIFYDQEDLFASIPQNEMKKFILAMFDYAQYGTEPPKFSRTGQIVAHSIFGAMKRHRTASQNGEKGAAVSAEKKQGSRGEEPENGQPPVGVADTTTPDNTVPDNTVPDTTVHSANTDTDFDAFWNAYPRKMGKIAAHKEWDKIAPDDSLCGVIFAALNAQIASPGWNREYGRYIPYPARWLAERRWEDVPAEVAGNKSSFDTNEFFEAALRRSEKLLEDEDCNPWEV